MIEAVRQKTNSTTAVRPAAVPAPNLRCWRFLPKLRSQPPVTTTKRASAGVTEATDSRSALDLAYSGDDCARKKTSIALTPTIGYLRHRIMPTTSKIASSVLVG